MTLCAKLVMRRGSGRVGGMFWATFVRMSGGGGENGVLYEAAGVTCTWLYRGGLGM